MGLGKEATGDVERRLVALLRRVPLLRTAVRIAVRVGRHVRKRASHSTVIRVLRAVALSRSPVARYSPITPWLPGSGQRIGSFAVAITLSC